jgi:hypothetical protein
VLPNAKSYTEASLLLLPDPIGFDGGQWHGSITHDLRFNELQVTVDSRPQSISPPNEHPSKEDMLSQKLPILLLLVNNMSLSLNIS